MTNAEVAAALERIRDAFVHATTTPLTEAEAATITEAVRRLLDEAGLVATFRRTADAAEEAQRALRSHFLPLVQEAIARGDLEGAEAVARRIPTDSVAAVFARDAIRQAKIGLPAKEGP